MGCATKNAIVIVAVEDVVDVDDCGKTNLTRSISRLDVVDELD